MKEEETPTAFGALRDAGVKQPAMFGRFVRGQLVAVRLADDSRHWIRLPDETAEDFELKVRQDLAVLRGERQAAE